MSFTGTYAVRNGKLTKISDSIPNLQRPVYFKGDTPYFDKTARRTFNSKQEKRKWLKENGLREGGIINPDKAPE